MKTLLALSVFFFICFLGVSKNRLAVLKYGGGGDWYSNSSSLTNLIDFFVLKTGSQIHYDYEVVNVGNTDLYKYPYIFMTGHGRVLFSKKEAENLRKYLVNGGFLHIDDNYGMDKYIRKEMKKVFPENSFLNLPNTHPLFKQMYDFSDTGMPKIHEHDNKTPELLAIIYKGRIVCLYSYETDLGDGWEDKSVHNNSDKTRQKALEFGVNILQYVFEN